MRLFKSGSTVPVLMATAIVGLLLYTIHLHTSYRKDMQELQAPAAHGHVDRHLFSSKKSKRSVTRIPDGYFPISVGRCQGMKTKVELCRLNIEAYTAEPYKYPMFKDLLRVSNCKGNTMTVTLNDLRFGIPETLDPAGFVFHESRVGSTLIANILAADPDNLVFSESAPPPAIALHCPAPLPEKAEMMRVLLRAMSNSVRHKRLFFKFQSVNANAIPLYTEAFPEVPWMFVYRDPVEVMASHFKQKVPAGAKVPCLRAKNSPTPLHRRYIRSKNPSDEEFCAAHLATLCDSALHALDSSPNGIAVNYHDLPDVLYTRVFPVHFGYTPTPSVKRNMVNVAQEYSKGRAGVKKFSDDSKTKQDRASEQLRTFAESTLRPLYTELEGHYHKYMDQVDVTPRVLPERKPVEGFGEIQIDMKQGGANGGGIENTFSRLLNQHPYPSDRRYMAQLAQRNKNSFDGEPYYPDEALIKRYEPYPPLKPLPTFLNEWPPDEPDVPDIPGIEHGTLERFDYQNETQRKRAEYLRWHEVPFVLHNVPMINDVAEKWGSDEYLIKRFGNTKHSVTKSTSNHFMYYNRRGAKQQKNYKPPTSSATMTFKQWLQKAYETDKASLNDDHYYLQLNSVGPNSWIREDFPEWVPQHNFFLVDPSQNRGINCRFGARGIIAEAHYDGGRNFVTILRGAKRYILLPPEECPNLYLYPRGHPEARHAKADWSDLDLNEFPKMKNAMAAQVVLRAGDVLYIPSYWFHYIVSTGVNAQCNTRSGLSIRGRKEIADCGFY
ncbi:hypothetical protein PTSG_08136 [Salpingoeca rosetta]|uniref:JmjC domain-containing protein n=1 Tax=Salpingoeca rosetta (strain ATCC 50818 / BSB-021) TaxID=946362 RepID=F2UI36_SALR5|nr:uncharacterized protein PTSG_08136 [Salpingoeca rosetta]EGD76785.1 hypothetical protein PTSG_08136 [Salpingoeca rosetta]|eukprot:XP_004991157.1 hypothetical protein PTSG_08136 [Salpingoeca rosetta]